MVNLIVHPINRTRLSDPSRLLAHSTLRSCLLTLPPTWIHPSIRRHHFLTKSIKAHGCISFSTTDRHPHCGNHHRKIRREGAI